ncbi:MAG: hypothetical protein WAL55_07480 [Candidatus Acidiferrales bacterium]
MKVIEIPPPQDLHVVTEEYPEGQRHVIRIEFYKMPDNSYYVWPYVRRLVGDADLVRSPVGPVRFIYMKVPAGIRRGFVNIAHFPAQRVAEALVGDFR